MKSIVWHCANEAYEDFQLQARAEEQRMRLWRGGQQLKVRATGGYRIGGESLELAVRANAAAAVEAVTVNRVAHASAMSTVVSVTVNGEQWWLELGPNRDERQAEMALMPSKKCAWELWFQVERDMFSHSLQDLVAFPVEVEGIGRPAIDWELACGPGLDPLADAVAKAWPCAFVKVSLPLTTDWTLSPDCARFFVEPQDLKDCVQGLLYCCLMLLNPWKEAAASRNVYQVLCARYETMRKMAEDEGFIKRLVDTSTMKIGALKVNDSNIVNASQCIEFIDCL